MGSPSAVIEERSYSFSGVFDMKHLLQVIDRYLKNRQYDIQLLTSSEKISGKSRNIAQAYQAEQNYTDYLKSILRYEIKTGGKETTIDVNGSKKNVVEGNFEIVINGFIQTDYLAKFQESYFFRFLKDVYHKFFSKDEVAKLIVSLMGDVDNLLKKIKNEVGSYVQ